MIQKGNLKFFSKIFFLIIFFEDENKFFYINENNIPIYKNKIFYINKDGL